MSCRPSAVSGLVHRGVIAHNAIMLRRDLLQLSAALGLAVSLPRPALSESKPTGAPLSPDGTLPNNTAPNPLRPPADGIIPVAFLMSDDAVVIDFAGPWEVFESVLVAGRHPFQPNTVAETTAPIQASGGMTIVPKYSLASAPPPKVIVIPAQSEPSDAVVAWLRSAARASDADARVRALHEELCASETWRRTDRALFWMESRDREQVHVPFGLDEMHLARELTQCPHDFGMAGMTNKNDDASLVDIALALKVHSGDKRADCVQN